MRRPAVAALLALSVALIGAPAVAQSDTEGEEIYQQNCATCHQPDGSGISGTFPPLEGNPNSADVDYVTSVILEGKSGPITVNGVNYDSVMTAVSSLDEEQVAAVAAFVATLAEGGVVEPDQDTTTTSPGPVIEGDADRGEALFSGSTQLANAAPACASCHSAGSHGLLGGPGLGPDLSDFFARFGGEAGVAAALANPPSATMTPLFEDHPLTDDEIADLTAYFAAVVEEPALGGPDLLTIFGLAGAAGLFGFLALFDRKPRGTYLDNLTGGTR